MVFQRLLKRKPVRYKNWERRTYPCRRWYCFRRSPAWRSFERQGKSWCDRHMPPDPVDVL